jgi:phenylpyruvate tautomerase PptA (4-oxalocrotonate tautomerase family)
MTTITVLPADPQRDTSGYRAVAGDQQETGATVGQALDALTARTGPPHDTTLVVVQPMQPDHYFTADQQRRMAELLTRWRAARDAGLAMAPAEQAELEELVRAEVRAAGERAAALLRQLPS